MRENYYNNNRIYQFETEVLSCTESESGKSLVELSGTYFYPEGGGQPADRGTIDGFKVLDVQKVDDKVIHTISGKPKKNKVNCIIDKEFRDHYMIQHTGQHLISAVLKHQLNIDTLSVHLGDYESRIEIDRKEITTAEIDQLEDIINELITSGKKVIYHETDDDGLKTFNIRRASKYSGYIRVVEIEGYDSVPCGGVHLSNLYELGLIKVSGYEKIRGHIRLTFLIGKNALVDYQKKCRVISTINTTLSTTTDTIVDGMDILKKNIAELKLEKRDITSAYSEILADKIKSGNENLIKLKDLPASLTQKLAGDLTGVLDRPFIIINNSQKLNWYLLDSKEKVIDFSTFKKELLPIISGKGGGREALWQGSGEPGNLDKFLEAYTIYIESL